MLDFIDTRFDSSKTVKYRLSIQISLDGFLFGIFDSSNVCIAAKSFNIENGNIECIFSEEPLLTKKFSSVSCIVSSEKSTLVPTGFFDKNKPAEYLKFICGSIDSDNILFIKIKKINAVCVFAIDKSIHKIIRKYQPQTEFYNQSIPLISAALNCKGKNMFIFFDTGYVDITVVKNENLLLHNSYKIENISDAVYFAAAVREQAEIEINNIYLSGKINREGEEEFSSIFRQAKPEMNTELANAVNAEHAMQLTILEKLNKCV